MLFFGNESAIRNRFYFGKAIAQTTIDQNKLIELFNLVVCLLKSLVSNAQFGSTTLLSERGVSALYTMLIRKDIVGRIAYQ